MAQQEETKRDRFLRLAEGRTNRALDAIRTITNLSNRRMYEWEEQDIRKISKAIKDAVSDMEGSFSSIRNRAEAKFRLR